MKPQPKRNTARWKVGALLVTAALVGLALLVGLTPQGLREGVPPLGTLLDRKTAATGASTAAASSAAQVVRPSRTPEIPPWNATPQDTSDLPAGAIPAWQVNAQPPPPSPPPPPPPEPQNPALQRPAMHSPAGVDGDRPKRTVPGLE